MMKTNAKNDFTFALESPHTPAFIFEILRDVMQWWTGLYGEQIEGSSGNLHDEFTFSAGGGMHNTTQRVIELIPDRKIVWQVTAANLTFLDDPAEWKDTTFG